MSKKHFKEIAEELKAALELAENAEQRKVVERMIEGLATVCGRFNSNFNRARFLSACGLEE